MFVSLGVSLFFFSSPLFGCNGNLGRWKGREFWISYFGASCVFIFGWLGLAELRCFSSQIQKNVNFKIFLLSGFCVIQFFCLFLVDKEAC